MKLKWKSRIVDAYLPVSFEQLYEKEVKMRGLRETPFQGLGMHRTEMNQLMLESNCCLLLAKTHPVIDFDVSIPFVCLVLCRLSSFLQVESLFSHFPPSSVLGPLA